MSSFKEKAKALLQQHESLISKKNTVKAQGNGIYDCYENPILTAEHAPVFCRYHLNEKTRCCTVYVSYSMRVSLLRLWRTFFYRKT